jgi:glycosyltransferase involved in cell wall biosynthesis
VSAILITYKQQDYVLAALDSLLAQTYPCQVVISDDASPDGTVALIRERLARFAGPHDVRLRAGARNLGVCRNQNAALELCSGELIVLFEGDDISAPDRVEKLVAEYLRLDRAVGALASGIRLIRSDGTYRSTVVWPAGRADAWSMVRHEWSVHGCSMAFRRECYSEFGPLSRRLISGDNGLWLRAAFLRNGGLALLAEPLVDYRVHDSNVSGRFTIDYSSAQSLRESCQRLCAHEIAMLLELRKIREYRQRLRARDDTLSAAWAELWEESRARAALVSAIANGPRLAWVPAATRSLKFPALRRFAINAITLALAPWVRPAYRALRGRSGTARIGS